MLTIPRPLATRLLSEAVADSGRRVCGLVGGRDGLPRSVLPVRNAAADPRAAIRLDPAQEAAALETLAQRDEPLLAVYHSHPASPPVPSQQDIADCGHPEALLLVISLNIRGVLEMRAFRRQGTEVEEIPVQVFL